MPNQEFATLPGSARVEIPGAEPLRPATADDRVTATVVLRRRAELPAELVFGPETLTAQQLADRHGADPADVEAVRAALTDAGLQVVGEHSGSRRITFAGPASAAGALFGAELGFVRSADPWTGAPVEHRARVGELRVPAALADRVVAVLGLDDRPLARPHLLAAQAAPASSYTPVQLGSTYKFPADTDGSGQTIAIIELGGGFHPEELTTYFQGLGLTPPSVTAVGVDGGQNSPSGDPNSADGEVLLDIEVAGGLAPKADQLVYFAPNTDQGFLDALSTAVHANPTPVAVSISWGSSEDQWTEQARTAFDAALADAAALGVTVAVAAGDNGSSDGQNDGKPHADFPASSPHALACGGTTLNGDSEVVWDSSGATGGGISGIFDLPDYQQNAGVPRRADGKAGRGVPDVSAVADPATGYQVLVDGQSLVFGGTSAVAPLWAALVARLAQSLGHPLGLAQTLLYADAAKATFRDVTSGDNGLYQAGTGWDPCTGLGTPDGEALLAALRQYASPSPTTTLNGDAARRG